MKWTETFYKDVFCKYKDFSLQEHDYAFGTRYLYAHPTVCSSYCSKFGGNAQCITRKQWVHHTSFLYDYNTELMSLLKMPQNVPQYRQARPHHEFLCKLKDRYTKGRSTTTQCSCSAKLVCGCILTTGFQFQKKYCCNLNTPQKDCYYNVVFQAILI